MVEFNCLAESVRQPWRKFPLKFIPMLLPPYMSFPKGDEAAQLPKPLLVGPPPPQARDFLANTWPKPKAPPTYVQIQVDISGSEPLGQKIVPAPMCLGRFDMVIVIGNRFPHFLSGLAKRTSPCFSVYHSNESPATQARVFHPRSGLKTPLTFPPCVF